MERDLAYETRRADELSAELTRCHDDVFTLRQRLATSEQVHLRQRAIADGVSIVTDVNQRQDDPSNVIYILRIQYNKNNICYIVL